MTGQRLEDSSRDSHLALRRVERAQAIIERLHGAHGARIPLQHLAREMGVSAFRVVLDLPEIAALLSSLAVLGPSVSDNATSAMVKLTVALSATSSAPPR
jgi:hypothetical protein